MAELHWFPGSLLELKATQTVHHADTEVLVTDLAYESHPTEKPQDARLLGVLRVSVVTTLYHSEFSLSGLFRLRLRISLGVEEELHFGDLEVVVDGAARFVAAADADADGEEAWLYEPDPQVVKDYKEAQGGKE